MSSVLAVAFVCCNVCHGILIHVFSCGHVAHRSPMDCPQAWRLRSAARTPAAASTGWRGTRSAPKPLRYRWDAGRAGRGKGGKLGSAGGIGVGRMSGVECIVADYVRAASEQHARCPAQRALCSLPSEHMLAAPCPASRMLAVMWTSSAQHARCHVGAQLVAIWMLVVRLVSANIGPNAALPM